MNNTIIRAHDLKPGMIVRHKDRQATSMSWGGGNQRKNWIGGVVKKREYTGARDLDTGEPKITVHFRKGTQLHESFMKFQTDAYAELWEVADEEGRFS